MTQALLLFVRIYQAALSPLLGGACRFHPSCSHYAIEALERHGAARGAWLAMKRLLRCRPFASGGYDPVPDEIPQRACDLPANVAATFRSPFDGETHGSDAETAVGDLKVAATSRYRLAGTPLERAQ